MAFLICYSEAGIVDWSQKAIYLEQSFYEQFFEICFESVEFPVLGSILSLSYDDEVVIEGEQLGELQSELQRVSSLPRGYHEQALTLIEVAERAQESRIGLAVSGDMHPVLKRTNGDRHTSRNLTLSSIGD